MALTAVPALSPAASLQPSFPPPQAPRFAPFSVPDSLRVRLHDIATPGNLPRFLLLGERDDESFERTEDGFVVEYRWDDFSRQAVCRLKSTAGRLEVEELWDGKIVTCSFSGGETLSQALGYHFRATLSLRDAQRRHPDGVVCPKELDPREAFFFRWFRTEFGINWKLPSPTGRLAVEQPEGLLRALVVPCRPGKEGLLSEFSRLYRLHNDVHVVDGRCDRLRHGSFTRRGARIGWWPAALGGGDPQPDYVESRIFVGSWRAVVEFARFLSEMGWSYTDQDFHAFACLPHHLVRPVQNRQGRQGEDGVIDVLYPPLLPPQEGLGVADGLCPAPLGDLTPYRSGGPRALQRVLREAVDSAFPAGGGPQLFSLRNPSAPVIWLRRPVGSVESTVPVLCTHVESVADLCRAAELVRSGSGELLKLGHQVSVGDGSFLITPNLPHQTHCYDPEGFFHLLPKVVRSLEEDLGTAWLVEDFVMEGQHEGRELSSCVSAGPREAGW
jgi:hypothetical protein